MLTGSILTFNLTWYSFELRDTASYTGERSGEAAEDITIKITLVHLAIIGDQLNVFLFLCTYSQKTKLIA